MKDSFWWIGGVTPVFAQEEADAEKMQAECKTELPRCQKCDVANVACVAHVAHVAHRILDDLG